MEYSSASEVPGSARLLFGPSLYSGSRGFATEIVGTEALPEPTRVERQDFASASATPVALGSNGNAAGMKIPFLYSDDELAVLAESFFNQNQRAEGGYELGSGDWWNSGNL